MTASYAISIHHSSTKCFEILRWLTCSLRPLTLGEVADAVAFDVDNEYQFNHDNRLLDPEDILDICSSLVIWVNMATKDKDEGNDKSKKEAKGALKPNVTMIRPAHFSVKEYLVSSRIRASPMAFFSIDEEVSTAIVGETCLSCLQLYNKALYSNSTQFGTDFPLAKYCAQYWSRHLVKKYNQPYLYAHHLAVELFISEEHMQDWIAMIDLDYTISQGNIRAQGSPLYYAVLTGLRSLVDALIRFWEGNNWQARVANGNKREPPSNNDTSAAPRHTSKYA